MIFQVWELFVGVKFGIRDSALRIRVSYGAKSRATG